MHGEADKCNKNYSLVLLEKACRDGAVIKVS